MLLERKENWRALELKNDIESVDGVKKAEWMGDMLDMYTPEAFLSKDALEQYKKAIRL